MANKIVSKQLRGNIKSISDLLGQLHIKQVVATLIDTSTPSASAGFFPTSADKFSFTGAGGPDMKANTTVGVLFETYELVAAPPEGLGAQTVFGYCSATSGYYISQDHNSDNFSMIVRNGGVSTSYILPGNNIPIGLHCAFFSRDGANNLICSIDGNGSVNLTSAFAYTNNVAGAQCIIGGVNTALVASGFPSSKIKVLGVAYINAVTSTTDLKLYSAVTNQTERYKFSNAVLTHPNLVSAWQATDWDGVSGTTTAGHGSAPYTWTKFGSFTKNIIKAENRWQIDDWWWNDTGPQVTKTYVGGGTYRYRNAFARFSIDVSAPPDRIGVGIACNVVELPAGFWAPTSMRVDGIPAGSAGDGIGANGFGLFRQADWLPGNFPAGVRYEFVDGLSNRNSAGTPRVGTSLQEIRLPTDISFTIVLPVTVADRLVIAGDSVSQGSGIKASGSGIWGMLVRQNRGEVMLWGAGQEAWFDLCADGPTITQTVIDIGTQLDGTVSNSIWWAYGVNDWGGAQPWPTVAGFQTQVAALLDAAHLAYPALIHYVQSPIAKLVEGANSHGETLQDFRNALATIASTRPWITFIDGKTFCPIKAAPSAIDMTQGDAHPTQTGQACMARKSAPVLGFTMDYPWFSSGKSYDDTIVPYAWVADSAFTGGGPTVTTWLNQKGGIDIACVALPAWAANYGPFLVGAITGNGTTQYGKLDALATLVAGSGKPFTWQFSVQPLSLAVPKILASFDSAVGGVGYCDVGNNIVPTIGGTIRMKITRKQDSGAASTLNTTQVIDTTHQVWTWTYDGTFVTGYLNGKVTSIVDTSLNQQPISVDQCTLWGFRDGGPIQFPYNAKIRSVLFIPGVIPATARQMNDGFNIGEGFP